MEKWRCVEIDLGSLREKRGISAWDAGGEMRLRLEMGGERENAAERERREMREGQGPALGREMGGE